MAGNIIKSLLVLVLLILSPIASSAESRTYHKKPHFTPPKIYKKQIWIRPRHYRTARFIAIYKLKQRMKN